MRSAAAASPFGSSGFETGARQNRLFRFENRRCAKFGCDLTGPVLKPGNRTGPDDIIIIITSSSWHCIDPIGPESVLEHDSILLERDARELNLRRTLG
jgi:hypothetical protein